MMAYDGSLTFDTKIDPSGFNEGTSSLSKQANGLKSTLSGLGKTIAKVFAVTQLVRFANASVQASNEIENSLIGLQSIVEGQGKSFQKAQKFIEEYVSDGLVPLNNAATAYKNLAARGYDEQQIQSVMIALKDSAAFGRQANLSLGDAVQNATEGLKNENSILVDNAGVTKNVAKMWDDYAKSIGTTSSKLTQQQKIQAEVTGILEETKFQVGDAAKVSETYSGQIMRLQFEFNNLKVAVGNFLKPIITSFLPVINTSIQTITRFANTLANISEAIFGKQTQQSDTIATSVENQKELTKETQNTAKAADKAQANFDEIQKLTSSSESSDSASSSNGVSFDVATPYNFDFDIKSVEIGIDKIKSKLDELKDYLSKFKIPFSDWLEIDVPKLGNTLKTSFAEIFNGLKDTFSMVFTDLFNSTLPQVFSTVGTYALPFYTQLLDQIIQTLTTGFEVLNDLFEDVWSTGIKPAIDLLIKIWDDAWKTIYDAWQKWGKPIFENVRTAIEKAGEILQSVWDNFLQPIWQNFMDMIDWLWTEHLQPLLANFADFIGELVNGALEIYNKVIAPIVKWLVDFLGPIISNVINVIVNIVGTAIAVITDVINGVITFLKGIIQFIVGVFTGDWDKAWEGVKNIFGGIWDAIVGVVKGAINLVIDLINGMIAGIEKSLNWIVDMINKLEITNPFTGEEIWSPNVPRFKFGRIPKLATGTVVPSNNGEFLAMLGDNKRETEVVSPLSTMKQALIEALMEYGGQNITIKFEESSIGDLVRLLKPYIDKENRRVGSSTRVTGGAY